MVYNLAFDFGASSGRLILSKLQDGKIELEELHRFPNEPVRLGKRFCWDFLRLYEELKTGLKKAAALNIPITSIGIDTWGVDYGFLDKDGNLVGMPLNYRDSRTEGYIEKADKMVGLPYIYEKTGIQFMNFNTIFQILADDDMRPEVLEVADSILLMPDLFNYFLTGVKRNEYTNATTGQLINAKTRSWDFELINNLGINPKLFGELVEPGTVIGQLTKEIMEETGLGPIPVVAVGSHDTASAVAGTPLDSENSAYLCTGTWCLLGMESKEPIINEASQKYNFTNEGGVDHTIRFLKNINGLWIIQQLRKSWNEKHNTNLSFPDIIAQTRAAIEKGQAFRVEPDDPVFMAPLNMADAIVKYCEDHGQGTPEGIGEIALAAYTGLVSEYQENVEKLEIITGKKIDTLHMVGGGIQDQLLCALTAEATGKKVLAGPIEASVLGNVLMQLKAVGEIKSLEEGRKIIKASFTPKQY
jgi:rhamnulokinase